MIIGGKCQGCHARLDYVLTVCESGDAPEVYPRDGRVAYRGGHLCSDCATAVAELFADRRQTARRIAAEKSGWGKTCPCCGGIDQGNTCCPPERAS